MVFERFLPFGAFPSVLIPSSLDHRRVCIMQSVLVPPPIRILYILAVIFARGLGRTYFLASSLLLSSVHALSTSFGRLVAYLIASWGIFRQGNSLALRHRDGFTSFPCRPGQGLTWLHQRRQCRGGRQAPYIVQPNHVQLTRGSIHHSHEAHKCGAASKLQDEYYSSLQGFQ